VGATGRLSPNYLIEDGVVPRTRLPHILRRTAEIAQKHQIRIVNVAHAGDGNVHPIVLFDDRDKDEVARAAAAGRELLEECIACGGSITAEHGVGVEKLALMDRQFAAADLAAMARVRDAFNPAGRFNPGKLLPVTEQRVEMAAGTLRVPSAEDCTRSVPIPLETHAPPDQAGVERLVCDAAACGTAIYPIGGGTCLNNGLRRVRPGIGLSLAGLNRVIDYPARDLTITVEAGVTMDQLTRTLAAQGQGLPIDVPQPDRATLGGIVAAGLSGPRRYRWGPIRDYVIGLRAVDGRGQAFSAGGRVVKNAAGYDLCRLLTGSHGTLGVIVQVTLMVKPMPESTALAACGVPDLAAAERLLAAMAHSRTMPAAIELLVGPAWQDSNVAGTLRVPSSANGTRSVPTTISDGTLVVRLDGSRAEVDWMIDQLTGEWRELRAGEPAVWRDAESEPLWRRLVEFPAACGLTASVVEINVLPGQTIEAIRQLLQTDPACSIQAHAGSGTVRAALCLGPDGLRPVITERLRPAVAAMGGSLVVRSCPPETALERETVWGPVRSGAALMQAIKDQFDPHDILNPGRSIFPVD
jgi:FAD/FMN-containing dehydrogenase